MNKLENFKKKLLYRSSYRGTKEMDILLSRFVKTYIDQFTSEELEDLDKFLDFEDEVIYNYYHGNTSNKFLEKNKISKFLKKFKL
tara:strand:+ start:823 stop:1077 length:255 start_codon:yes stop_codon:yes gene_type:complete